MSQGHLSREIIHQIRERIDIIEVVSGYLTLSKSGQNFRGLCPFHHEKTPSFNVNPSRQFFHCFGCQTGGDVFTFVMKKEGIGFFDAVKELASRVGMTISAPSSESQSTDYQMRERLEQLHDAAAAWFHRNLCDSHVGREAMDYLASRGIETRTIDVFRLGLAMPTWDGLIKALFREGYEPSDVVKAGLATAKDHAGQRPHDLGGYYDRFRSRLMVPIRDIRKRIIAFGGRILTKDEPKYLNSPETPLFSKSRTLYALDRARESAGRLNQLIIVEGYFDAITLHQAGITNVVATLGTALTPDHLNTIRRYVGKVVLLFDPDPAGVQASLRTLDVFVGSGLGVTVISLPEGKDPDTFVRTHGVEAFARLLERAPSLLDFAVEHSLQNASGSIDDRIRRVDEILQILQKTGHRIEKEECLRRVAERLGISQQRLIERYPELLPKPGRSRVKPSVSKHESRFKRNPEEWDLVYCLLQGQLNAAQVNALRIEAFTEPVCHRIVQVALGHLGDDGRVLLRPLLDEAAADPQCGSVVTELAMAERHFDDMVEYVNGCLETLERKRREQNLGELIVKLRRAEQEGRSEEARRLNAEVNELRLEKAAAPLLRAT